MARDGGLGPIFRANIPEAHWQMVETGGTGLGVPDANYCLRGAEGWVELKRVEGWRVPSLQPTQVAWAEQRLRAGGRVFLAARKGSLFWFFHGSAARAVLLDGVRCATPPLVTGEGGPARWPWAEVRGHLLSGT